MEHIYLSELADLIREALSVNGDEEVKGFSESRFNNFMTNAYKSDVRAVIFNSSLARVKYPAHFNALSFTGTILAVDGYQANPVKLIKWLIPKHVYVSAWYTISRLAITCPEEEEWLTPLIAGRSCAGYDLNMSTVCNDDVPEYPEPHPRMDDWHARDMSYSVGSSKMVDTYEEVLIDTVNVLTEF